MVNKNGFTLIEAMIAIAIIAISMSIAVPYYQEYVWRAKAMEAFSIIDELKSKVKKCYLDDFLISNCNIGDGFAHISTGGFSNVKIYKSNFTYNNFIATINLYEYPNARSSSPYSIDISSNLKFSGTQNSVLKYSVSYSSVNNVGEEIKRTLSAPEGWNWNSTNNCLVYNKRGDCYDL